jgi:hypothetical protein
MASNKTGPTDASVEGFITALGDESRESDATQLCSLMADVTGRQPRMWGPSMIGFGDHHYVYDSGREGDTFVVGFSPRKSAISLYLTTFRPLPEDLLDRLGNHRRGKGCLYVNRLSDVDLNVLRQIIEQAAVPAE